MAMSYADGIHVMTHHKEDTDCREDYLGGKKHLKVMVRTPIGIQRNIPAFTMPTPPQRVVESALTTFTVGVSHLVSRSSLF